jgi:four helix bundle protein
LFFDHPNEERRTKNEERRTKNEERRTKNEERRTKNEERIPIMKIERFEDIEGWQLARILTREVSRATKGRAFAKDSGLVDQIRRASGSTMHNVAEGFDGGSNSEFIRFLRYSQRSGSEVQSQLYVALDQDYIDEALSDELYGLADHVKSKVGGFINYLQRVN